MARTLTTPGPLDILEEAFDLLQHAPASVWLRYLAGAAPLIVGLLFVWNEFSSAGGPTHNPVIAALFLVALLVWFYRCRQIFAGHLRGILSLKSGDVGAPVRGWLLACFEGTKLIVIPLAAISVLPLAYATAFYRSLTLFAAEGLGPREASARAWKAAIAWQRENWFVIAILNLLGFAVIVDVSVTVILAPMLVKIFTGYESVSMERGSSALGIQFPVILALTWLCFDPLLQAVYTVRAFQWEGLRTGEDLLVRLRRLAPLLVLFCLATHCLPAAPPTLSRDNLNNSIDQTLNSPDYAWRIPPPVSEAEQKDWFIDTVDRIVALVKRGWTVISDLWSELIDWIGNMLRNTVPAPGKTQPGKPTAVRPVFYLLGLGITGLALALLWKFGSRKKLSVAAVAAGPSAVDLTDEALLASDLPEDEWLQMAERYAGSGDLRLALRALYLGTLALLNHRGLLTVHACKSNRDYERELRRRSRDNGLTQIFGVNIRSFERSWYGFHDVTGEQLQIFRENLGRMRTYAS